MTKQTRWIIFFAIAIALLLPGLGLRDFYTRGEPREALIMQAILKSGDWILPAGYNGAVPSKPLLLHWLSAIFSLLIGQVTEFTARLPSALASFLFIAAFGVFLRQIAGEKRALYSCLILLGCVGWFKESISARVDLLLAALLGAGLLRLFLWAQSGLAGVPWLAILLFVGATLTKGPVSIVLPGAIFGVYLLARGSDLKSTVVAGLKVFLPVLILSSGWYILAAVKRPADFFGKFYYENVQRFLGTQEDEPHKHGLFYLPGTLVLGFLPWTLFCAPALWAKFARREGLSNAAPGGSLFARCKFWLKSLEPFQLFSLIVALGFLFFYSIPSGKRDVYLLPAYPFIAYSISSLLAGISARAARQIGAVVLAIGLLVLALYLAVGGFEVWPELFRIPLTKAHVYSTAQIYLSALLSAQHRWGVVSWVLLSLPALAVLACLAPGIRRKLYQEPVYGAAVITYTLFLALNLVLFPIFANAVSAKDFAGEIRPLIGQEKLYSFGAEYYGLSFYLDHQIWRFDDKRPVSGLVVLPESELVSFGKELGEDATLRILKKSKHGIVKVNQPIVLINFHQE